MPMKNDVGVMAGLRGDGPSLQYVAEFGLKVCQLCGWNKDLFTDKLADSTVCHIAFAFRLGDSCSMNKLTRWAIRLCVSNTWPAASFNDHSPSTPPTWRVS